MLRKLAVALVAASLIGGPALAQGTSNAPATGNSASTTTDLAAKVKVKKHVAKKGMTKKHVAKTHVANKQVANKHVAKKHLAKKHVKHAKRVKHPAKSKKAG
jgi:hypothetical protein